MSVKLFRPTEDQKNEMKMVIFDPNVSMNLHRDLTHLGIDKTEYSSKIMNIGRWVDISGQQGAAYKLPYKITSLQKNYKNEIIYRGVNQNNSFGTPISDKNINHWLTEKEASEMYNANIDMYIDIAYNY